MNVAFCVNGPGLRGLGVTLSSLILNCSKPEKLRLWFLCADLSERTKKKIKEFIELKDHSIKTEFIDFDPEKTFGSLNPLHGDWTNYGRILLPDVVTGDQVLYLDADLVVELDVLEIENFKFEKGHFLAAVGGGNFKYTLGHEFYLKIGLSPDLEYFNDGVLLINNKEWRSSKITQKFFEIANLHARELPSHEQSVLNIICAGKFARLPSSFNCSWIADQPKPNSLNKMIIHFIGAPKPWDPFAILLHNGFNTWNIYHTKKNIFNEDKYSVAELKRLWQLKRSYGRCIRNHFKNILLKTKSVNFSHYLK